jgi:hypothetical protein
MISAQGIIVSFISPGKVDTRMLKDSGWPESFKSINPRDSAEMVIEQITALEQGKGISQPR